TIDFLEIKNLVRGINANDINLNGSINNSLNRVCNSTFLPYSNGFIEVIFNDLDGLWRYSVSNIRKKSKTTFVESFNSGWKTGNYSQYVYDGDEILIVVSKRDNSNFTISDIPSGLLMLNLSNLYKNIVDAYVVKELELKVDAFEKNIDTGLMLSRSNIFGKNKQYSHIFIGQIYDSSNPTIPCQSSYDLSISKRLGFNIVEANIQKTATVGKYVVMHGVSGTVGGQLVYLNGDSANSVVIQDTTFDDLRNNFKYKSIYTKYQTKIISLEEWCGEVKKLGLTPLVQYVDDVSLNIIKDYFGYDFILYNGTRDKHTGTIMRYSNTLTKQQMIDLCEEYKPPLMINVSSLSNFVTDNELIDAIKEVHKRGCLFGICGCYMSANDAVRAYRCGADFSASDSEVNPIEYGDIYDINGELTFSDFATTGTLVDNSIVLNIGDTITVPSSSDIPFLHASSVAITYNGKLTISLAGLRNPTSLSSNGEECVEWSGFAINTAPYLTITANEETTVKSIRFLAKKM
ncbi:MAG: hypothetical protein RBR97_07315, partial [Bacteroidales bacterium]|nr:hypothetical protein [Bacteroidales bacterium]